MAQILELQRRAASPPRRRGRYNDRGWNGDDDESGSERERGFIFATYLGLIRSGVKLYAIDINKPTTVHHDVLEDAYLFTMHVNGMQFANAGNNPIHGKTSWFTGRVTYAVVEFAYGKKSGLISPHGFSMAPSIHPLDCGDAATVEEAFQNPAVRLELENFFTSIESGRIEFSDLRTQHQKYYSIIR